MSLRFTQILSDVAVGACISQAPSIQTLKGRHHLLEVGVVAVEGVAVGAVVGAGVVIIPEIALPVGVASVRLHCSGEVHAAIAAHTVSDVVVAGSSMNSCSVHRVVVLHTLADGVML